MGLQEIDKLFAQTLTGDYDDDFPWQAVNRLRNIGDREVFECAAVWCSSEDPLMRARGADVLSQIGRTSEHAQNNYPDESYLIVSRLAQRETEHLPLMSAIHSLGHIANSLAIPLLIEKRGHSSPDVRFAVACALGKFAEDPSAVKALMTLMEDADADVRDWATFGLGVLGKADSSEIREALLRRVSDWDSDVRKEALRALAGRMELRAVPALITELNQPGFSGRLSEAAELFLGSSEERSSWDHEDYAKALKQHFLHLSS